MKYVLLSADNNPSVYSVPDMVADNLDLYCNNFCNKWLLESPHAECYRIKDGFCYNEEDFIKYLNTWIFPNEPSILIETLDWIDFDSNIPEKYKNCKWFNF